MTSDVARVTALLTSLLGQDCIQLSTVLTLTHNQVPIPQARPRFLKTGARTFTPKRTRDAQQALAWAWMMARDRRATLLTPVALVAIFYRPDRRRLDVDNLLKLVLDAATKAEVWKDDSQVVRQTAIVEFGSSAPRTVVALCGFESVQSRTLLSAAEAVQ